jgi:WD40 repeat protein/serine/threonine protein kinase
MTIQRDLAKSIFANALEIAEASARQSYLDAACGGDESLRREIQDLLAHREQMGAFLESPAPAPEATVDAPIGERPGTVIGPYKLLEQIGEGGFGFVFMAEQQQPIRRKVALKVLKPGMDTRQVVARFEAERQALALMDHPNIAHVFDGGETTAGRPYFVMELVRGIPVTNFCDQNQLPIRARLELFLSICQAIQHAHQKGIIHRDIKPSNVLVASYDGVPVPKVIDFGIAKATGQQLTDKTLFTNFAQMIGTPLYMSPEQAHLSGLDVDTRSDIYSLGVLLYELLTGTTPFNQERFRQVGYDEMRRIIREEEPPKPSTRISTLGQAAITVSTNRKSEPRRLSQLIRGELDWIVMKCLEKDRNRRYETANSLALDIQRYLHDEPVQACPPSAWYRFGKFARRNKGALVTAGLLTAALVVMVVVLAISNVFVARERDQKAHALLDREEALEKESAALAKATEQETLAKKNAATAETQRRAAQEQERIAKENLLTARRHLHAAKMNLADQAWQTGHAGRALALLESLRPQSDAEDLRRFEWYYLWRLCHLGHRATLRGHRDTVFSVAISADSKTLFSASRDGTVRLRELHPGERERTLRGNGAGVGAVALSPDSKILACGTGSNAVELWDVGAGRVFATLHGYNGKTATKNLAFSPDGKLLAWGALDKSVKIWDVENKRHRTTFQGHNDAVTIVAFSPDGKTLASAANFGEVKIWDLTTGQRRFSMDVDRFSVFCFAFSPDGKLLASGGSFGRLRLWEVSTGREHTSWPERTTTVFCVAFSPDGKRLAWGTQGGTVRLRDLATGQMRAFGHAGAVWSVAFSPDSKFLVSAGEDRTIKISDAVAGPTPSNPEGEKVYRHAHPVFAPDGRTLASGNDNGTVELWDVATARVRASLPGHRAPVVSLAFSTDSTLMASASDDQTVRLWEVATGKELAILGGNKEPLWHPLAFSPDGKSLASGSSGSTIALWDVATRQKRTSIRTSSPTGYSLAWSPDGKVLASGYPSTPSLSLWDAATGQLRARLPGPFAPDRFSADGKTLAAAGREGVVFLDVATGHAKASLKVNLGFRRCASLSPDWKTLAVTDVAGTIKLWDMETGQERATIKGADDRVHHVEFSPDGSVLAIMDYVGTIKFLRTATEQEVRAQSSIRGEAESLIIGPEKR